MRRTRRGSLEQRVESLAGSVTGSVTDISLAESPEDKKPVKEKRRRRRRKEEGDKPIVVAPPPRVLTFEEKATSAPLQGVVMETLFPGDGLNFPQDGEVARVHFTAKVRCRLGQ
jgi:hypothetical protein